MSKYCSPRHYGSEVILGYSEEKSSVDARQVGGTHYKDMAIEPWEVCQAARGAEAFREYLLQTAIAYLMRAGKKGEERLDVKKAHHCLEKAISTYEVDACDERIDDVLVRRRLW